MAEQGKTVDVTYDWTVPSDSIKDCLYDDNDIYYEYDDYQDDVKIESPSFGTSKEPNKFVLRLYPRSTEGCSDCGSLVIQLKWSKEDEIKIKNFKISISSYSNQIEKNISGICKKSTLLSQSLGWRNTFAWKDLTRNSSNLIIYCEVTYLNNECDNISNVSLSYHHQRLSKDFGSLLERSRFSDVMLCTSDGKEFPSHKAILSARSSVFDAMFRHEQLQENMENRVCIDDISSQVLEALLNYIYCGDTSSVDQFSAELLIAADKYDIQSLINLCVESMMHQICTETAAKLYYTADVYQLSELKQVAINFINLDPLKVIETDGWKEYIKIRPDLIEELYKNLANKTVSSLSRFH